MRSSWLLVVLAVLAVAGCGGDDGAGAGTSEFAAAAERAVRDVGAGDAALLDVRTDEEVGEGRAAGARHLPLARIEAGERPDLAKDRRLYVYCATGRRAAIAVRILRGDGYSDVTNIGGLADWERAGGDVER